MAGKQSESNKQFVPDELSELSSIEICTICQVEPIFIQELVAYGTVEPRGISLETWVFNSEHLKVVHTAARLHHDLEINHPGIALAIDLMQEIEDLRQQVERLEKFLKV